MNYISPERSRRGDSETTKPNYVISILARDISEILLKCPKCYITILTENWVEVDFCFTEVLDLPIIVIIALHF